MDTARAFPATASVADDFEAFFDTALSEGMTVHHVPGAAVAVVQGGEVVLLKGYGFADLERGIPVDPDTTLFRVASVSKLFTIAAALQMAEEGEPALESDVNEYLTTWQVANPFPEPVRVRHLLAHTDGFGTRDLATFALRPEDVLPLGEILALERPAPVTTPGRLITYGGYGTALAGHLVERVSWLL